MGPFSKTSLTHQRHLHIQTIAFKTLCVHQLTAHLSYSDGSIVSENINQTLWMGHKVCDNTQHQHTL